jgi:hypothetical protein
MPNLLDNNRMGALMTILVLAIGSISIVGTIQFVKGLDGDTLKNLLAGCIYGACKDTKITGNFTNGTLVGCVYGACKDTQIGQSQSSNEPTPKPTPEPTPTTGTLIVTKVVSCPTGVTCPQPSDFTIRISSSSNIDPVPQSFPGSSTGTEVKIAPSSYDVDEPFRESFIASFSPDCDSRISVGDTKMCTVTNTQRTP